MLNKDRTLGDSCKWFEKNFSVDQMIPGLPVIIRIDGNNFHNWTKGLIRPFDEGLVNLMIDTTKALVKETNAIVGYTQSDEITLILYTEDFDSQIYNDGKKQKILSKLTGFTTNYFNAQRAKTMPHHNRVANFDCRIYQVPSLRWAANQLLWRENDAIKNSISMVAQTRFSSQELHKLTSSDMKLKLEMTAGFIWDEMDTKYKRGTYVKRVKTSRLLTEQELLELPEKHQMRKNPEKPIERSEIIVMDYPEFNTITNRADVIFKDSTPLTQ